MVTKGSRKGITRRGFLKTSAVAAGLAATADGPGMLEGLAPRVAEALDFKPGPDESETVVRGACRGNCFGFCHVNCHIRDGKLVKTSRGDFKIDPSYNRICQRGLSHPQRVYDPDRLKYPLRRVEGTERGAGQWERISWDEAFELIAEKITEYQSEFGPQAVYSIFGSGNQAALAPSMYNRLWNILQTCIVGGDVDMAVLNGMNRIAGPMMQPGECNEPQDMVNAKAIVTWGANPTDAWVHYWHFMKEAQQGGTKLVVVDPSFTQIASKADLWVPIRPGTDSAMYLGIMNIAVERDAVDCEFMRSYTVAPFLVKSDDGLFLRRSDFGVEPETGPIDSTTGEPTLIDPYMVLQDGAVVPLSEAQMPQLEGSATVNGVECRTAYDLLMDEIAKYPPEVVADITDVPVETVHELAGICIDTPVTHFIGYGSQAYSNGTHIGFAGMTMCALLGNLGKPGASFGAFWYVNYFANFAWTMPTGPNPTPSVIGLDFPAVMETGKFKGEDFPIKMAYVYNRNILHGSPDTNKMLEAWNKLEFTVVADTMMTDTACYADLVLPVASWFEQLDASTTAPSATINLGEKAIEPLYETKSDPDIVRGIAAALGISEYFTETDEEALRAYFDTDASRAMGMTYEKLLEDKELRLVADFPHIAWRDGQGITTASGRFEFYAEAPAPRAAAVHEPTPEEIERERLPRFFPPMEAWHENELMDKYPMQLTSRRARFRVHSQWYSTKMFLELEPEPTVEINPVDAQARGIEDGAYVECYNDRGHAVAKAVYSSGIRPGMLVYPKGWHKDQHKSGNWCQLLSAEYDPFSINGNFMDCLCEIRVWDGKEDE